MVASKHEEILWVFNFVCEHETNCLDRLFSSVNVIAKEQIVSVSWESCIFEQFYQIWVLSVYVTWVKKSITTDFDGCLKFKEHGLFEEDLSGFDTESSNFRLK